MVALGLGVGVGVVDGGGLAGLELGGALEDGGGVLEGGGVLLAGVELLTGIEEGSTGPEPAVDFWVQPASTRPPVTVRAAIPATTAAR
jgi:hypothetical protein